MSILFIKLSLLESKYDFKIFYATQTLMHPTLKKVAADVEYSRVLRGQKSSSLLILPDLVANVDRVLGKKCTQPDLGRSFQFCPKSRIQVNVHGSKQPGIQLPSLLPERCSVQHAAS